MSDETAARSRQTSGAEIAAEPPEANPSVIEQREPDIKSGDWDCLYSAVTERLRATVGASFAATHTAKRDGTLSPVDEAIRQCADALDQLHLSLTDERRRRRQLESELLVAQHALAEALIELAGSQEGALRARQFALHDSLTALPNRSFFRWRLENALAGTQADRTLAVLYLDLDSFKSVNDAHGHDVGDEPLRTIATRLTLVVRSEDVVSRVGGDEFACLLPGVRGRNDVTALAGKLVDAVTTPVQVGDLTLAVRPSIGIAVCPDNGTTAEALLKNADVAMYSAKRNGTGYAFFLRLCCRRLFRRVVQFQVWSLTH